MTWPSALALSARGSDVRARAHARRSLLPPSAKRSSVEHHWSVAYQNFSRSSAQWYMAFNKSPTVLA